MEKERSLIESLLLGWGKLGSTGRQVAKEFIQGHREAGAIGEIWEGEREVTPSDFAEFLEDRYSIDLTPGSRDWDEKTFGQKAATFGRDFVIDVFTSPDSLLGAPAKLLKAGNIVTNPTAAKAITGGVIGLMSSDSDDEFADILGKVTAGAAIGGFGGKALGYIGKKGSELGEKYVLDPIVTSHHADAMDALKAKGNTMKPSVARTKLKGARERIDPIGAEYYDSMTRVEENFINELKAAGADEATINNALTKFDKTLGIGESRGIKLRSKIERATFSYADYIAKKKTKDIGGAKAAFEEYKTLMAEVEEEAARLNTRNRWFKEVEAEGDQAREMYSFEKVDHDIRHKFGKIAEEGHLPDEHEVGWFANAAARDMLHPIDSLFARGTLMESKIGSKYFDEFQHALKAHTDVNDKMARKFNKTIDNRIQEIERNFNVKSDDLAKKYREGKMTQDEAFALDLIHEQEIKKFQGIPYHTVDLRGFSGVDDFTKIGEIQDGARKRLSSYIEATREGVTRQQAREIGAERFAKLFLDKTELQAGQVLSTLAKASLDKADPMVATLNAYDDLLKLQKTVHLTTGTNWILNNFTDNLVRAYMAAGPSAAFKVLGHNTGVALNAIGKATNIKALQNVGNSKLYDKMLNAFNPAESVKKIQYKDDWLNLARDVGVIDSDKFQDFYSLTKRGDAIVDLVYDATTKDKLAKKMAEASFVPDKVRDMQEFMWDTVGRLGSANENTARYITFEEVVKSKLKDLPNARHALSRIEKSKDKTLSSVMAREFKGTAKTKYQKGLRELQQVFKESAGIVNDTFFDYSDVTFFEQQVMKRIFPYWTFVSRNMKYWVDKFADPEMAGKMAKIESITSAVGETPSDEEREEIPKYLLEKGARVRGDQVLTMPSLSIIDAAEKTPIPFIQAGRALEKLGEGLAPVPKELSQQLLNKDFFTGGALAPTEDDPKKRVFESAFTLLPDSTLENLGVYRDEEGKIYTNNPIMARLISFQRNILPAPSVLDQAARATLEAQYRDQDVPSAIGKQISPVKSRLLTAKERQREKRRAARNRERFYGGREELLRKGKARAGKGKPLDRKPIK